MIEDVDWLEKYNTICDKASADIKMKFGSDPVCNKNFENQNKISWQWIYRFLR